MKKGSVYQVFRVGGKWYCDPVFDDCDSSISNTLRDIVQFPETSKGSLVYLQNVSKTNLSHVFWDPSRTARNIQ